MTKAKDDWLAENEPVDDRFPRDLFEGLEDEESIRKLSDFKSLRYLQRLYDSALDLDEALYDCKFFQFLSPPHLRTMELRGSISASKIFWREVNQLLTYIVRGSARSTLSLVHGLLASLRAHNELLLSLTARAFIEHACLVAYTDMAVATHEQRLREVWQAHVNDETPEILPPSSGDKDLHGLLFRCAVGKRVHVDLGKQPPGDGSIAEWQEFVKMSGKLVSGDHQALHVLKCIDKVVTRDGFRWVRTAYDLLCEYCHPNAASRALDFETQRDSGGKFYISEFSRDSLSPAFHRVWSLVNDSLPALCFLMKDGLNSISTFRLPMEPIDDAMRYGVPQVGHLSEVDDHGRMYYYRPTISFDLEVLTDLTPDQASRAEAVFRIFSEFYPNASIAEWLNAFAVQPPPDAEVDLRLWEHTGRVYLQELTERPPLGSECRRLLFVAAIFSRGFMEPGELLSSMPRLKTLPDWERVFRRIKDCIGKELKSG